MKPSPLLVAGPYPFAVGAIALNVHFASLILGWIDRSILTPLRSVWAGLVLGPPAAWGYARHVTRLMRTVDGGVWAMTDWGGFALAFAAFLGTHFVPTRPPIRKRLVATFGRRAWFSAYGIVSLAVTAWVIRAAGQAPDVEIWPQLPWTRWVPNLLMPLAIALAVLGLPARTVTLGGPRMSQLNPTRPGMAAVTRHPLLWALTLWSLSHLAPNGSIAHILLFGGFAAMALAAMPAFDARARRTLPTAEAAAYFAGTAVLSPAPFLRARWWREAVRPKARRLLVALLIWALALVLHPWLIGASPLPF